MAVSKGIGEFRTISMKIRLISFKKVMDMLTNAAYALIKNYDYYQKKASSRDVTGNARMSVAIGIYYMRHLEKIVTPKGIYDKPTRRTLKEGEAYNLPFYYGGAPVGETPYVGKDGNEHQWGPTLGPRSMKKSASSRATYQMKVIMPIEYAPFAEHNNLAKLMQNMLDDLPNEIDYSISYVRGKGGSKLPSQTNIPF